MPTATLIAPRGGIRYDIPADLIDLTDMSDARNVFFEDGFVKKRYGYTTKGSNVPLSGAVMKVDQFHDYDGNSWLVLATNDQMYKWRPGNTDWDTLSDAGGYFGYSTFGSGAFGANAADAFTATDSDAVDFAVVRKTTETGPWLIITNGVDAIKKWTGTGAISNLLSSYPSGVSSLYSKYMLSFKTYLILLVTTENGYTYPHRMRWSNTALPDDFLNGNASFLDLSPSPYAGNPDEIQAGVQLSADYIGIFKGASVWSGYATGDSSIFQMSRRTREGTPAGRTVAVIEGNAIYMGHEDIFAFDGQDVAPIGGSIRRELFSTINPAEIKRSFAKVFRDVKQYWLCVPYGSNTYPDVAWCLHYETGKWTRHSFDDYLTAAGDYIQSGTLTIGELVGTIGQQTWRIGDRNVLASAPTTIWGDSSGNVYEQDGTLSNDNGTAIDSWFTTKDFNPTNMAQRFRINRIDTYYTGFGLDLSYSTDKGKTWTSIATLSDSDNVETPQPAYLKFDGHLCRLRWRNNTAGEHYKFSRATVFWEPSGGRL